MVDDLLGAFATTLSGLRTRKDLNIRRSTSPVSSIMVLINLLLFTHVVCGVDDGGARHGHGTNNFLSVKSDCEAINIVTRTRHRDILDIDHYPPITTSTSLLLRSVHTCLLLALLGINWYNHDMRR